MATSLSRCARKCIVQPQKFHDVQVRTHKFKTKNPRPKPMPRRVFEEITKPIYPDAIHKPYLIGSCLDPNRNKEKEPNPYEEFLLKQFEKTVWSSEMFVIAHLLPSSQIRLSELKKDYIPAGIQVNKLNNRFMRRVIKDTKLSNLAPLLVDSNVYISCPEVKVKEMLAPLKRYPEILVLGGYVSGRLVTQHQLKNIAKLPPIEYVLGELVSVLNLAAGGRTHSLLNSHQQRLSTNLEQYRKQLEEPDKQ